MYFNKDNFNQPVQEDTHVDDIPLEEGVDEGEPLDLNRLMEAFVVDTVARMNDVDRQAFLESDCFKQMCEAGVISEARSVMRLNREDDLTRRIRVAAIEKAHQSGDQLWERLRRNRVMEKDLLNKIYKKYSMQVKRDAIQSQKKLIKINPQVFNTLRAIR